MWLYNAPPKDKIKAKYGFELTAAVARSRASLLGALQQWRLRIIRFA